MGTTTNLTVGKTRLLVASLVVATVICCFAAFVVVPTVANAAVTDTERAELARASDAAKSVPAFSQNSSQELVQIGERAGGASPVGTAAVTSRWKVKTGELALSQNEAVLRANPLNIPVAETLQWVTLPVSVSNIGSETATPGSLNIQLITGRYSQSHTFKDDHHYPAQTLPDELDTWEIPAGKARTGNVGWLVPVAVLKSGDCAIEVTIKENLVDALGRTTRVACYAG